MKRILSALKNPGAVLAAGALVLSVLAGLGMQPASKVEAAPGGGAGYFLKIDGISGESADAKHKNEIELNSYSWSKGEPGLVQTATSGGGGAGKVQVHDIHFKQDVSKASPQLMQAVASGKHIKEAVLTVRKAGKGQQEYLIIKMSDVVISSYRTAGDNSGVVTDEFSLNFAKIEYSYSPQKADGSLDTPVVGLWDFRGNKEL